MALSFLGVFVAVVGDARGDFIGKLWENDLSEDASVVPATAPDVTFTTPAINYISGGLYTIDEFLNSPTYLTGAIHAGDSIANTHIQITGSLFLNAGVNDFEIAHDDGIVINISGIGTVLFDPGTSPGIIVPFTITAPADGLYSFTLDYNECCGAPGVLLWTDQHDSPSSGVPDSGSTGVLLSLAMTGIVAMRRSA